MLHVVSPKVCIIKTYVVVFRMFARGKPISLNAYHFRCAINITTTLNICQMAKKYYSNSFQMHEQRGSFNGIDTCNISTYRKFDFNSSLLSAFESSSILNRPDKNALLRQLVDENVISKSVAVGKRDFACETYSNYDFDKYCKGATYVPFDVALAMHKETTNNLLVTVTIDER